MPYKQPTVRSPYVDRQWLPRTKRVQFHDSPREVDLIDADTGCVVYTTPAVGNFDTRALRFARRHGLQVMQ